MVSRTTTLVVMGVSGSGKTTTATALADATGHRYVEGDELHPESNRHKLAQGVPLTDEDRWPWLRAIADLIGQEERAGRGAVITCSALRRRYRDLLRDGHPSVRFVYLRVDRTVLRDRVEHRQHDYMPAALLDSQLDDLEPPGPDEPAVTVDASVPVAELVGTVLVALGSQDGPGHDTTDSSTDDG